MSIIYFFIVIAAFLGLVNISLALMANAKHTKEGNLFCKLSIYAALTIFFYLISIVISDYTLHSVFTSLYFLSIDFLLNYLLTFIIIYAKYNFKFLNVLLRIFQIYAAIEVVIYIINPFCEFAISYATTNLAIPTYTFVITPVYSIHLIYSYILVALSLILLIYKTIVLPHEYRLKYLLVSISIIVIVLLNAVFLFIPGNSVINLVDISIILYGVASILIYIFFFGLSKSLFIKHFQNTIFKNINQGILVFDYDNQLIFHNEQAETLMKGLVDLSNGLSLDLFLASCSINMDDSENFDNYSLQIYVNSGASALPLRIDYKKLLDKYEKTVGHLVTLSNVTLETDLLTGFHRWVYFKQFINTMPDYFPVPCTIAVCDINGLSTINSVNGHAAGDAAIKSLADRLQEKFLSEAYYVRGDEAHLIVISRNKTLAEAEKELSEIKSSFEHSIQFA